MAQGCRIEKSTIDNGQRLLASTFSGLQGYIAITELPVMRSERVVLRNPMVPMTVSISSRIKPTSRVITLLVAPGRLFFWKSFIGRLAIYLGAMRLRNTTVVENSLRTRVVDAPEAGV